MRGMRLGATITMGLLVLELGLPWPVVAQEQDPDEETTPAP